MSLIISMSVNNLPWLNQQKSCTSAENPNFKDIAWKQIQLVPSTSRRTSTFLPTNVPAGDRSQTSAAMRYGGMLQSFGFLNLLQSLLTEYLMIISHFKFFFFFNGSRSWTRPCLGEILRWNCGANFLFKCSVFKGVKQKNHFNLRLFWISGQTLEMMENTHASVLRHLHIK